MNRLKENHCLSCSKKLDAATSINSGEDIQPKEGDYSVCLYCGKISRFTVDGDLTPASAEDLVDLHEHNEEGYFLLMKASAAIKSGVLQLPFKK